MTEAPRRRNRGNSHATPEDTAASDFLKKFKKILQAEERYARYFKNNDKGKTYARIKSFYKTQVMTNKHSEQELVQALHNMLTLGTPLSDKNLAEAYKQKASKIKAL